MFSDPLDVVGLVGVLPLAICFMCNLFQNLLCFTWFKLLFISSNMVTLLKWPHRHWSFPTALWRETQGRISWLISWVMSWSLHTSNRQQTFIPFLISSICITFMVYQISFTSSKQAWLLSLCFLVPKSNLIGFPLFLSLF